MSKIECRCCKINTKKRVVVKRNPLRKSNSEFRPGYEEYYCSNIIKSRRPWYTDIRGKKIYKFFEEECRNNIIVKKIKRKE